MVVLSWPRSLLSWSNGITPRRKIMPAVQIPSSENIKSFERMRSAFCPAGRPHHRCTRACLGATGHCCTDIEQCRKDMCSAMIDSFLHQLPPRPSPSKWTKLFGSPDLVFYGLMFSNFLSDRSASTVPLTSPSLKTLVTLEKTKTPDSLADYLASEA
jgi:hypothetical protein